VISFFIIQLFGESLGLRIHKNHVGIILGLSRQ